MMGREIERKFLVQDTRFLQGRKGERIVQGYLAKDPGEMSTRIRIRGDRAFLTLKSPRPDTSLSREEFEYPIPVSDAEQILARHCGDRIVEKTRFLVEHHGYLFEVDVFEGRLRGLVLAEVELPHEQATVSLPAWIGEEVSHDRRYGNSSLAQFGLPGPTATWLPRQPAHQERWALLLPPTSS